MAISYSKKIQNSYFNHKTIIGLVGDATDLVLLISNIESVKIKEHQKVKALIGKNHDFIKALGFDEALLTVKVKDLGMTYYQLLCLINAVLIKPEMIILDNIELTMNPKMVNRMVRFLKTVQATFKIKVLVISRDATFLVKLTKDIVVVHRNIIKYQGSLMPAIKQHFLPEPAIIKFIAMANQKGAGLTETLDERDLLKNIYRSVR